MAHPTALVLHPDCARHDPGWGHPEHQGRLPAIIGAIYQDTPALIEHVLQREGRLAAPAELLRVHTPEHVELVRRAAEAAQEQGQPVFLDADTVVSAASWDAALAAVGCAITAVELVLEEDAASAFAATRPPGHHASADTPMGFCLFNNVAVAARWAQAERGIGRVLIVDWDVHHGNGTQDIFYEDPTVYYLSLHLSPHYPGTGSAHERGAGAGLGTTRNIPLAPATTAEEYLRLFRGALDDAVAEFAPELVLVSAGFDCLAQDPLGGLRLEPQDLHALTAVLLERARPTAAGRVVALLEGGYVPRRMGEGVVNVLRALAGLPPK
ncbi:MAG: histone deacetylase [Gemmatimonadetes bacterium]|nr:histone deacetylase [Gemmatimonadota bacterium]